MCSGKKMYTDYGAALEALFTQVPRPELGSCYQCPRCGEWHISSRRFTLTKGRGRGGTRRGAAMAS